MCSHLVPYNTGSLVEEKQIILTGNIFAYTRKKKRVSEDLQDPYRPFLRLEIHIDRVKVGVSQK